jgi:hypothetical protein
MILRGIIASSILFFSAGLLNAVDLIGHSAPVCDDPAARSPCACERCCRQPSCDRCILEPESVPIKKTVYEVRCVPVCEHRPSKFLHCDCCPVCQFHYKKILVKREVVVGHKCTTICVPASARGDAPCQTDPAVPTSQTVQPLPPAPTMIGD